MDMLKHFIFILIFVQSTYSLTFESYIADLFSKYQVSLLEKFEYTLQNLHSSDRLVAEHEVKLAKLLFYHMLFTTTDAINGQRGGILEIPYLWHWTSPNPRHEVIYNPEGVKLNEVPPPEDYKKYQSYADVDRTPYLYLENLMEEEPLFNDPLYGSFYTFGWCSEREMAFAAMLNILGYETKIKQEGIHVWTEVMLKSSNGACWIVKVDNTFNGFQVERLDTSVESWKKDIGEGTQVIWYNKKIKSESELYKIKAIEVGTIVKERIDRKIINWINKK